MGEYDAIVVGVGIAVLGVAAILSKEAKQMVLVVDRFPWFGGRMMPPHLMLKDM